VGLTALLLPLPMAGDAAAQAVVACRDRNMQIVACASGGGGSDGGGSYGGTMPGAGAMGAAAYGMGYAIGTFLRSLMVDDTDYAALARQEQQRQQDIQREQAVHQDTQDRWRRHELGRQQQFQDGQRELLGQIRPLGPVISSPSSPGLASPGLASPGSAAPAALGVRQLDLSAPALPQAQAVDANRREMLGGSPEQARDAAGRGFDTPQAAGSATGPLMQVRGVPQPPPAPTQSAAPDPNLRPMSLQQRLLIAEGRKAQGQLDQLRQRRQRNEIDADGYEREETALKGMIARLAQQFAAAEPATAASTPSPSPATPPAPALPRGNVMAAAAGDPVGSCAPSDPTLIGCIEIRNTGTERVRVYLHELPGVFCTIEPGSMCSRPAMQGVYNGFAEREDGRRTSIATLLHTPAGVRWGVQF